MKSRVLTNVFFAGIFILCQWSGSPAAAQSDSSSTDVQEKIRNDTVSVIKKSDELYLDVGFAQWQLYFTASAPLILPAPPCSSRLSIYAPPLTSAHSSLVHG